MTKKARKRASKQLTRKQRSRLERERQIERLLIWGVTIVGIVVVGVLAYGFIVEKVVKARESVAIVGDTPIRTAEFQARVRFVRMQMINEHERLKWRQQALDATDPDTQVYLEYIQQNTRDLQNQLAPENALIIGEQVLEQLIQEELVRQEAERRGITVAPDELQQAVERSFGYERNPATPTPTPVSIAIPPLTSMDVLTPTPTFAPLPTPTPMTEQEFRRQYNSTLDSLRSEGISEQQFRSWFEAALLLERLREQARAEVPDTADQVKLHYLTVDSEERANELAGRLDAGEDFQTLVDELEEDEEVAGYGTEFDWLPRDVLERGLGTEISDLAFSLEVGEHSQPVLSQDGTRYVVIKVVGHEERELDQLSIDQLGDEAFQAWLTAQQSLVERRTYRDRVPMEPELRP